MTQIKIHRVYEGVMPPAKAVIVGDFEYYGSLTIDDTVWHTVQCTPRVGEWVRQQEPDSWTEFRTANNYRVLDTFELVDSLYIMLALRWQAS